MATNEADSRASRDQEYRRLIEAWKLPFTVDCVNRFLAARLTEHRQEMINESFHGTFFAPFDSPLEYAFLVCWNMYRACLPFDIAHRRHFYLQPQVVTGSYRVDFQVKPYERSGTASCHSPWPESGATTERCRACPPDSMDCIGFPKIAVELDGHEFHEKTKDQVTARNARDRALLADGWTILRFSGSEFYRDPCACVAQVWAHALEVAERCDRETFRKQEGW